MKVEEPIFMYGTGTAAAHLRGQIIKSVEKEQNPRVLQHLYFVIEQLQKEECEAIQKKGLRSLRGVLKSNGKTYDEMRQEYLAHISLPTT